MRVANYVMAALFVVCVAIQHNDPDPARWMVLYACAAVACLQMFRWAHDWIVPLAVGLAATGWAVYMTPGTSREASFGDLFRSMDTPGGAELARELGGLVIVVAWMAALVVVAARRRRRGVVNA